MRKRSAMPAGLVHALATLFLLGCLPSVVAQAQVVLCPAPYQTFSERVYRCDISVVVTRVDGEQPEKPEHAGKGITRFRISRLLHASPEMRRQIRGDVDSALIGVEFEIDRYYPPKPQTEYLASGNIQQRLQWKHTLTEVDDDVIEYAVAMKPVDTSPHARAGLFLRTRFLLKHLESDHPRIAEDVLAELDAVPLDVFAKLRRELPREALRKVVFDPTAQGERFRLYGILLGFCGEQADKEKMEKMLIESSPTFRGGFDGVYAGYLLLAGEEGLKKLERAKFDQSSQSSVAFSDTYFGMQAVRMLWLHDLGSIDKSRLQRSFDSLLERPEVADIVIGDFARWKDWSVFDRVVELYDDQEIEDEKIKQSIRIAIIRYLILCSQDIPPDAESDPPHVLKAKKILKGIRLQDPELVERAERFFIVR